MSIPGYVVPTTTNPATKASAAVATSADVVAFPRDSRTAPRATDLSTPMASSVGDGSSPPEWHPEPVDAATSGVASRTAFPDTPGNDTLSVFGRPRSGSPWLHQSGHRSTEPIPEEFAEAALSVGLRREAVRG